MGTKPPISDLLGRHVLFNGELNRNVAGIRSSQDLFDDLEVSPENRRYALALESRTRETTRDPVIEEPFLNGVALTWPFLPNRWHATRFSDGTRYGVWYGSPDLKTTAHETVHNWLNFVTSSFPGMTDEIVAERHVSIVRCQAELADLRDRKEAFPALVAHRSHTETQRLGRQAHARGEQGLLVPSARQENGVIAAIFRQSALSRPRNRCYLTYRWDPLADRVTVEITPGRTWMRLRASDVLE